MNTIDSNGVAIIIDDGNTLTLTRAISVQRVSTTELTFREPTGNDLYQAGYPFKMQSDAQGGGVIQIIDAPATRKLISLLAGIPTSSVDQMSVGDWTRAMGVIAGFFADTTPPASSNAISMPAAGGATSPTA